MLLYSHQRSRFTGHLAQIILIGSILPLSWLGMMIVHEFGHALAAWCSGGTIRVILLHPLKFSSTEVDPNPHPLLVTWSGALVGGLLPLALLGGAALGLLTWHRNGPHFGLGAARRPVKASDAVMVMALLLIVITIQLAWGGRFTFG